MPVSTSDFSQLLQTKGGRKAIAAMLLLAAGYLVELRVQVGTLSWRMERIEAALVRVQDDLVQPRQRAQGAVHTDTVPSP